MSRDFRLYLQEILESIERIDSYIEGHTFDSYNSNQIVRHAVERNLEIIGEAVKNIPENVKMSQPDVP